MTTMDIISNLLLVLSGLGIFMYGLKTMSDMLEMSASGRLRSLFNKITNNRFMGIGIGAGVTAIIQSSSATTVMVVGLVNAGLLNLYQATSVIMGANIGTTVTALIISLKSLPIAPFLASISSVGIFMVMFTGKSGVKAAGSILIGLGLVFGGLIVMGNAMTEFSMLPYVKNFFILTNNPFLLLFIGMLITAIIQSSSATTGILITMGSAQLIGLDSAIFIILGVNIGTCITALIASVGANANAKRAALIHLMFNVIGSIFFFVLLLIIPVRGFIIRILPGSIENQIAVFHLIFNITTTLLLVPFINGLVFIAKKVIRQDKKERAPFPELSLQYLNELVFETPILAVSQVKNEILRMYGQAVNNLEIAIHAVTNTTLKDKEEFEKREQLVDYLNKEITRYLVKISSLDISFRDEVIIGSYYHVVSDIERIGDYAENIFNYAIKLINMDSSFSDEANSEIKEMFGAINELKLYVLKAFINEDIEFREKAFAVEERVDEYKHILSYRHIQRLNERICTPDSGALFLSLVSNLERIADHMINICKSIDGYARKNKLSLAEKPKFV